MTVCKREPVCSADQNGDWCPIRPKIHRNQTTLDLISSQHDSDKVRRLMILW